MAKANLNNYIEWFELVIDATTYKIDEPIGWSKIEISLERNEQYYGFDYEVLGETATLEFNYVDSPTDCIVGGNLLIEQYRLNGQDAEVNFRFGYIDENAVDIVVYESTIDFNLYNLDNATVKVGARRISFNDLFRNRFETAINLTSSEDLDGNAITPLLLEEVGLHSKGIFKQSERLIQHLPQNRCGGAAVDRAGSGYLELRSEALKISAGTNTVSRGKTFYAQPAFSVVTLEDLTTNFNVLNGVGDTGINPQWSIDEAGEINVTGKMIFSAGIHLSEQWTGTKAKLKIQGCTRGDARMSLARIELKLKIGSTTHILYTLEDNNAGCDLVYLFTDHFFSDCTTFNAIATSNDVPNSTLFDNIGQDNLETDSGGLPPVLNHDPIVIDFDFTQTINAGDEVALYLEIHSEGEYNENTLLASDIGYIATAVFWENNVDGGGSPDEYSFMNITLNSETPDSTAKTALIHETGASLIEVMTGNANRLRSDILGRTDSTPTYAADGCASLNGITGGFQIRNFEEDERPITTTFAEYVSSIQAVYNIGMALEKDGADDVIRLEEVNYFFNPLSMLTLDEPSSYKESVATELIYNSIKIGYDKFLDSGLNLLDEFNTEHEYSTPIKKYKNEKLIICSYSGSGYMIETQRREQFNTSPSTSAENDDTNFIINLIRSGGGGFQSLKDEGFTSVSGVFSPSSSYNLKISPKRMLYRWAKWLKSSYRYKNQATEFIRFVFGFQNKDLTTEITASCEQGGVILEKANVLLEDFPNANAGIYSPEWVEFDHALRWAEFADLRDKLKGAGGGADNYGYIKVLSPLTKEYINIWVYGANYNISSQNCRFKGLKADL